MGYYYTFTPSSYLNKDAGKLRFKEIIRNCPGLAEFRKNTKNDHPWVVVLNYRVYK